MSNVIAAPDPILQTISLCVAAAWLTALRLRLLSWSFKQFTSLWMFACSKNYVSDVTLAVCTIAKCTCSPCWSGSAAATWVVAGAGGCAAATAVADAAPFPDLDGSVRE